jgi:EmrB/QacA subfamily drug resistance transporter
MSEAAAEPPRRNARLIALIVACAMFMAQLDTTVVATALPQMADSFGVTPISLSIGITVYILTQTALLPASSWLSDRFGGREVFAASILGFTVASVLCGLCQTLPQFIAARALQGATAALMTPVGRLVLLQSTDKADLIRVMTISTVPMLVAPTIGPAVGGFITTYLSWHWIFYLNLPIGIVGVALVLRFIPKLPPQPRRPFDGLGFLYTAIGVSALLYGLDRIANPGEAGWIFPSALTALGAGLLAVSFNHARRAAHPLISLPALKIPTYTLSSIGGGALVRIPIRALPFILVLMLQLVHGMSAFHAGLLLLASNAGDLVVKPATTPILRRYGFRTTLIVSGYVCVLPVAACALFVPGTPDWIIFAVLTVNGIGRSFLFTGMSTLAFADVPQEETGGASVLWYLGQMATQAFGISLAAILMNLVGWSTGAPYGTPTLFVCQATLVIMGLIGVASVSLFFRLAPDAGAHVSGHKRPVQTG